MMRMLQWTALILALCLWSMPLHADDEAPKKEPTENISPDDMKIIAVMETLQMMDLIESMDMLEDLDVLLEENQNEDQD